MSVASSYAPIRVVLIDDHEMVREALARILEVSGRITIVAQASSGTQAIALAQSAKPEVMVLDYTLPDQDAPTVIEELNRVAPDVKVLVLTVHENIQYAVRVLETGAFGYLIKSAAFDELVEAIGKVRNEEVYLSSKISSEVLRHMRCPKRERVGIDALSQREFDLLQLLGSGKSLQECAVQMEVTTSTASTYRGRIMEKLNLTSTASVIRYAIEHELVK